jgi:hypothetical protein
MKKAAEIVKHSVGGIVTEDDLSYLMREFVQCSFPYKNPGDVEEWTKTVNGTTLTIKRGRSDFGTPHGVLPRLGTHWLCTQIVENPTADRYALGRSIAEILSQLKFAEGTSKHSARRKGYLVQLRDLFACNISFTSAKGGKGVKSDIGKAWDLWGDEDNLDQGSLFESWVAPTAEFREAVQRSHVPVPKWALMNHVRSPMELDLLGMLSHRVHLVNNKHIHESGLFITTDALKKQFGADYTRHRDFRQKFSRALSNIKLRTWPTLRYEFTEEGLTIFRCPQLVLTRQRDLEASYVQQRRSSKPERLKILAEIMQTREFDTRTRNSAEMRLRGLSYSQTVAAFWGFVDENNITIGDPRALFLSFCTEHRRRNRA